MTTRLAVAVMAVLLLVYIVIAGQFGYGLLASGLLFGIVMGTAVVLLPLLALWFIGSELRFGMRSERLVRMLAERGELPEETRPLLPSGRPDRRAPVDDLERWLAEADAAPESWEAWFRLGLAHDAAGDRAKARASIRRAIALERADRARQP